nr:MAG TPA: hypothetical protein [Caudoviricetes sp.]
MTRTPRSNSHLRHPPPRGAKPVAGFPGKPFSLSRDFAGVRGRMELSGFP